MMSGRIEVGCEHIESESRRVTFGFHLGDHTYLRLCDGCYERLKAVIIQDVLNELAKNFAQEIARMDFSKR